MSSRNKSTIENKKLMVIPSAPLAANPMLPDVDSGTLRPILFSTEMVKAILDGRKTQTRRLVKFPKDFDGKNIYQNVPFGLKYSSNEFEGCVHRLYPKWQVGDILWVRETFLKHPIPIEGYKYKADYTDVQLESISKTPLKWKPSLFMPKDACRLWLKVTNIFAERLTDISAEDCVKEGIELIENEKSFGYKLYGNHSIGDMLGRKAVTGTEFESYQTLWENINGKGSFDENPFVWVIEFERCVHP